MTDAEMASLCLFTSVKCKKEKQSIITFYRDHPHKHNIYILNTSRLASLTAASQTLVVGRETAASSGR